MNETAWKTVAKLPKLVFSKPNRGNLSFRFLILRSFWFLKTNNQHFYWVLHTPRHQEGHPLWQEGYFLESTRQDSPLQGRRITAAFGLVTSGVEFLSWQKLFLPGQWKLVITGKTFSTWNCAEILWANYNAPLILNTSSRAPCFLHMTNILSF